MLLSGGVDSTVCAALMRKGLSDGQVTAIHIDNGFMRKNESDQVKESLEKIGLELKGRNEQRQRFAAILSSASEVYTSEIKYEQYHYFMMTSKTI